jgi:hypothetical protein
MGSQLKPLKIRWFCSRASGDNTYPVTTCVTTFGQHLPRALRAHSLDSGGTCEVGRLQRAPGSVRARTRRTLRISAAGAWRRGDSRRYRCFCVIATNRTPSAASSWILRTQSATLRPQRSSFHTRTASKRLWRALRMRLSSCGQARFHAAPAVSTYSPGVVPAAR